jgi:acyl-CoA hydrolase/RimJ/RimL family protein N-acetyltransferase
MAKSLYWADSYLEKKRTAPAAIQQIRSGQRVFIGSACGEPQVLVRALAENARRFSGVEIVRMMSHESVPLTEIATQTSESNLSIRHIYLGSARPESFADNVRFIMPMNISDVPELFKSRKLPIDVALIQVSPPDDFGWMSLGVSVDVTLSAAYSARIVIAQVNPRMPRVMGQSFIHVNDVNYIVEHEDELWTVAPAPLTDIPIMIGRQISRLIEDGSTLQVGLDANSQATVEVLSEKNDLGLHSQYFTNGIMNLYALGVITNRKKGLNEGKMVASAALGTRELYEFLDDNPAIEFQPSDYVNDPYIISRHNRMVSLNVAHSVDLTGQVSAEAVAHTLFAGVSGIADFVRGARRSRGGKSILMLPSTYQGGTKSRIVPMLHDTAVVVARGDVQYVATEYGVVNLFGKNLQERVVAMISIAHPKFRDELFEAAKQSRLIGKERSMGEASRAIYPVALEEKLQIEGETLFIRPAKPVDERRIREHYYSLDQEDVFLRFFHEKTAFERWEVENKSHIDYIKDLTLIGVIGESGFDKVVAVAEYLLLVQSNMAEVAFTVNKEYQGKGIGKIFMRKIAAAAREQGIAGLVAYTAAHNQAMIRLFKTLPYKVRTSFDGDALTLTCRFDEIID